MEPELQNSEDRWLAKARDGDSEAFANIVEAYQAAVFNLCYRMLGNAGDAEDAAQETFIRAFKALKRYDPDRKFSTWLLSIASNYCIDQLRRRRLQTFSMDGLTAPDIADAKPGIEREITLNEEQEQVREMLAELNPTDRAAVVLRYWYEFSYEEIAEQLSLTVSAVKSRLHRSRHDLAVLWERNQSSAPALERTQHESPAF